MVMEENIKDKGKTQNTGWAHITVLVTENVYSETSSGFN